ncbi:MAG: PrpF domain-containing protein, partial [Vibrio sp.]
FQIDFLEPTDSSAALLPTGHVVDTLDVPGEGCFDVSFINAGIPTLFLRAEDLGYQGTELQGDINSDPVALARFEKIRAHGALKMGLIKHLDEAKSRQHTPKIAFVSEPKSYQSSSGKTVQAQEVDLLVRALSMGQLHHAMMGTAAVAIGSAAAIEGTLVHQAITGQQKETIRFGHPSGSLEVGAKASYKNGVWAIEQVSMNRSARILMQGWVFVPHQDNYFAI